MDWNDLPIFVSVVEHASFSAAARALGLPPSTVSRRISQLEERLSVRLLVRTTRSVRMSDAGRVLYDRARDLVSGLDDVKSKLSDQTSEPAGPLTISAPLDLAGLHSLWDGFGRKHPRVQLSVHLSNRYVDLHTESFDLALRAGRPTDPSLVVTRVGQYALQLVASPSYLKIHGEPSQPEDLWHHDIVLLQSPAGRLADLVLWRDDALLRVPVRPRLVLNNLHAAYAHVCADGGIAMIPEYVCRDDLAAGRVVPVLMRFHLPPVPLFAVFPDRRFILPSVRSMLAHAKEVMTESFGDLPPSPLG